MSEKLCQQKKRSQFPVGATRRVASGARCPLGKSDRLSGYIHPCIAYPLGDLEILL
jgi:hypothetical protein